MKQPVHVTVQMDTVGTPVKVSVHIACMGSKKTATVVQYVLDVVSQVDPGRTSVLS